jgi:hypothetical protein
MVSVGRLLEKDDPQRFVWFGRAALSGYDVSFLNEMNDHILSFGCGTGHAKVVFVIGRDLN